MRRSRAFHTPKYEDAPTARPALSRAELGPNSSGSHRATVRSTMAAIAAVMATRGRTPRTQAKATHTSTPAKKRRNGSRRVRPHQRANPFVVAGTAKPLVIIGFNPDVVKRVPP